MTHAIAAARLDAMPQRGQHPVTDTPRSTPAARAALTPAAVTALLATDIGAETVRDELAAERFDDLSLADIERLVAHAVEAGLLPEGVLLWALDDGDGAPGGALITWSAPDGCRYASHHQDAGDLTTDRDATGDALALAVLEAVALTVRHECCPPAPSA